MKTLQISDIFRSCQFAVDFAASSPLSFKRKKEIRRDIVDNGGTLSYILTKQTSFLVTGNAEKTLSSYKGRTAIKYRIPVVSFEFITECIKSGKLLDPQPFLLAETLESQNFGSGKIAGKRQSCKKVTKVIKKLQLPDLSKTRVWLYKASDGPEFDEQRCEISKDVLLHGFDSTVNTILFYALELHVIPPHVSCTGSRYRIFTHHGDLGGLSHSDEGTKECRYFETATEALGAYVALYDRQTKAPYSMTRAETTLSHKIGSDKMKQMTISDYCSEEDSPMSPEVANLIDFIWNEATGSLNDILAIPVDSIKLEDVEKAEAILLLLRKSLDANEGASRIQELSDEFFSVIPHKSKGTGITSRRLIAQKQDLCQLMKDMVSIGESTNWLTRKSVYAKYRALKSHIECLTHDSDEFEKIQELVNASETGDSKISVLNVFSIHRPVEESAFCHDIGNKRLLFHSSKVTNFVGILSRGLLMPKIVVDDFGGQRSDPGMLGSGIYFASSASTSAKYSAPGSKGTRLMLVNEVALGKVKGFRKFFLDLTSPPPGYNSCHGLMTTDDEPSDFKEDEFTIYNGNQQKIRYLVEFVLPGDTVLPRDDISLDSGFSDDEEEVVSKDTSVDLTDVMSVVDPLTKVEAGLQGTGDKAIPLQSVHIKGRLLDLAAQVIVFQEYKNNSTTPIEAKYVFPLDDMAAVCGFEAFINGKHIVGEVKEKEQAHKEYREAISQGHGAYLMDEETPDVFTVSVGNLPPGALVLIKITYVTELTVDREHICFSLPGSVAPWTRDKALDEVTQTDVETVKMQDESLSDLHELSVEMSVEMPFEIRTLESPTHVIATKRTATKAVVQMKRGQPLGDGFQLLIGLAEIHVPRMWVERHVSKPDSQACMLTFYPEFEAETPPEVEVVFLLDLSCSMKGTPIEEAKKILLMCLSHMKKDWTFNILVFGSKHSELFPCSKRKDEAAHNDAVEFVKSLTATRGSTELWRVLQKLYLVPTLSTADHPCNLFFISDGHVTEEDTTLDLIRRHYHSDRLFTFGVGSTANRYLLRAMSRVGAGASEFFDSKAKSKWERKVKWQLSKAEQPGLTSVAVTWEQHDSGSSPPVQAPNQLLSLFNGSRQVVCGFADNCTQATLTAKVNGKTVSTMVSTTDMNITTGKILHQLTARAIIRDWDEGSLHEQRTGHEIVKRDRKDYIISLSKEFSVVSKFTSFVAVEHREKDEIFDQAQGPSMSDLVLAEDVDILPYIAWQKYPGDDTKQETSTEEKLEKRLEEAKVLETSAVLELKRLGQEIIEEVEKREEAVHALSTDLYESRMDDVEKARQIIDDNAEHDDGSVLWDESRSSDDFSESSDDLSDVSVKEIGGAEERDESEEREQAEDQLEADEIMEQVLGGEGELCLNMQQDGLLLDMEEELYVDMGADKQYQQTPAVKAATQVSTLECADVLPADVSPQYSPTSPPAEVSLNFHAMDRAEQVTDSLVEKKRLPAMKASKPKWSSCSGISGSGRTSLTKNASKRMVKDDDEPIPELGAVRLSSPSSMSSSKSTTAFGFPAKSTGSLFGSATKKTPTMGSLFGQKPTFTDAASPSSGDLFGIPRSKPTSATGFSFGSGPRPFGFGGGVFVGGSQAAPSVQGPFGGSAFHSFPEQAAAPVSSFGQFQQMELKPAPTTTAGTSETSDLRPSPTMLTTGMEACFPSAQSQKTGLFGSGPDSMSSSKSTTAFGFPAGSKGSLFGSTTGKTSTTGSLFGQKPGDLFGIPRSKPTSATGFSFGSGPRPFGFGGGVFVGGSQAAPSVQGPFGGSAFQSFPEQAAAPVSSFGQLQQTELKPAPNMFGSGPDSNTAEAGECLLGSSRPAAPPGSLFGQTQQTQESSLVAEAVEKAEPVERQKQLHVLATPPPIPPRQQPKDKDSKGQPSAPVFSLKRRGAAAASPPPPPPCTPPPPPPPCTPPLPPPPPLCSGGPPPLPPRPGSPFDPHRPRPTDKLYRNLLGVPSAKLKSAKVSPELRKPELYMRGSVRKHPAKEEALDEMPNLDKGKERERARKAKRHPRATASNSISREEKMKLIFSKQNLEGFWKVIDLTFIGININSFTDLLENAGARSLGPKIFEEVQKLLATLMMLAFIKLRLFIEFPLPLPPGQAFEVNVGGLGEPYSKKIAKALKWIKVQEKKIPLLYSRLEFGANWEAATQTIAQKMNI